MEKEEETLNREEEHINKKFKIKIIDEFLIIKRLTKIKWSCSLKVSNIEDLF
ncbi:MAG: hypothetical protein PHX70_01575 [Clostridium sp.]|nr:hypothetical protein [Clostridium sp.]